MVDDIIPTKILHSDTEAESSYDLNNFQIINI